MRRGIAAYLGSKLKRHALINFLLFLEIALALVFGATGFETLTTAQSEIEKYPSEYERLSAVSGIYGDEEKNKSIFEICAETEDYSFIYPFTIRNVIFETAWEGQIVQASVAELMSYKLEEGRWFDTSVIFQDGVRQAVADDVFCQAFGCSLGEVITVEYGIDGKYSPLKVKIVGINDYSSTGIGVGYDGTLFRSNMNADDGMITVLADDDDLSFYDGGAFTAFRLDMPGEDKQAFMQAGIRVTESVAEDYDEYYKEQTNTRNIMLMLCVSVMLLAASTSITTSAVTFDRQKRENAIAFACGLSRKNAIVCETVKDGLVLVFALFVGGAVAALISYTGMMPGVNGMSGFAIAAAIVSVMYAVIKIPFHAALGKTEPIDGIKEKTI